MLSSKRKIVKLKAKKKRQTFKEEKIETNESKNEQDQPLLEETSDSNEMKSDLAEDRNGDSQNDSESGDNDGITFEAGDDRRMVSDDDDEESNAELKIDLNVEKPKKNKGGVIYMGYVPEGMTIKNIRMLLGKFGDIGRIYLEREGGPLGEGRGRRSNKFVEGWIEFKKKSVAKMVAATMNGQPIGGRRRTKFYGALWNLKYLKRFKWSHLAEQMAYEKAMREQRLRLEINQAKKEAEFYANMIDRSRHKRAIFDDPNRTYKQRQTDEQIRAEKSGRPTTAVDSTADGLDEDLLESIFK